MISAGGRARMLSKENSPANPSFRVYYGVSSGAVPFFWESRPGTPKHAMAAATLPPLTPPPSYYTSSKPRPKSPKRNFIRAFLPGIRRKRRLPSPPTTSTNSSSNSTSPCSHRRGRSYSATSSFSSASRADDGEISPISTLCFGERIAAMAGLKKALLAVVGNRSGPRNRRV
ncbi:hypothetical protein KSP40_PGU003650 [Platanthera guangdongensis]|uniref:Uncharacterized protein n=1 Tax=Platanthera guangdongensis TaxID=2320717 RepID=A0ABR2MAX1_9ASPA